MAPPAPRRRRKPIFARSSRAPDDAWLAALRDQDGAPGHGAERFAGGQPSPEAPGQAGTGEQVVDLRGDPASETDGTGPDTDAAPRRASVQAGRGREAESPADIPARGWKDIAARTFAEAKSDHVPLLAAGVAFFALLALVPAMVAFVSLYGLLADPTDVARHVADLLGAAPSEVQDLVTNQLEAVTSEASGSIGFGLVAGVAVALWSASSGMKHVIEALNAAYDEEEGRGFVRQRGLALLFTVGAVLFMVAAIVVLTVVPALLEGSPLGSAAEAAIGIARWPALALAFAVGLAVLYRYGPSRDDAEWRWVTPGAVVATVLWIAASAGFSVYVARFGSYNETYGSLGGIVVAMLWLFLTAYVALMGAELDAEMERQTLRDTTEGHDEPLGQREAMAADTVGATADEVKAAKRATKTTANR
ncbi:MAG: YihY/virulence factor BrkB family protein [Actinomycetota bacterium]